MLTPNLGLETLERDAQYDYRLFNRNFNKIDESTGKYYATFVIGHKDSGHTSAGVDFLCTGTDDQLVINNAIAALPSGGGKIIIREGIYNLTGSIDINKNNVTIEGMGYSTVLLRQYNEMYSYFVNFQSSHNVIKNLRIDGNRERWSGHRNNGIILKGSNNIVANIKCDNNTGYGIEFDTSFNSIITGSICNNNGYGIEVYRSSGNIVSNNIMTNNTSYGIEVATASVNNTLTGNVCTNNSTGIYIKANSNNNSIIGNVCSNNISAGILLELNNDCAITGNTCNNNKYGIKLSADMSAVTGNICKENDCGILLIYGADKNIISGNVCMRGDGKPSDYADDQYTILLSSESSEQHSHNNYNLISSNIILGKNYIDEGGTGNTFVNNKYE